MLMILQHSIYAGLAKGSHELFAQLFPRRGTIYIQDSRTGETFPFAMNKDVFTLYADTREIEDNETAERVAEELAGFFEYTDEENSRCICSSISEMIHMNQSEKVRRRYSTSD